ncbi:MAG: hypothetical protein K8S98_05605 [Planctomycetes bacterium]|nr:hypothetical protein [Planctomycetota bacterium]
MLWLAAAFASFVGSVSCWFFIDKQTGLYIGLWVPSILALGCMLNSVPKRRLGAATAMPDSQAEQRREAR